MDNKEYLAGIKIYTDGACSGNPGPGGWGAVLLYKDTIKRLQGGFAYTTNGRMELMAAIMALSALKRPCGVTLYTDAAYLANAVNKKWLERWQKNGWRKTDKKPVHNADLWRQLAVLLHKHDVQFVWVKGHAENEYNNICDHMAVEAAHGEGLPEDVGYKEQPNE